MFHPSSKIRHWWYKLEYPYFTAFAMLTVLYTVLFGAGLYWLISLHQKEMALQVFLLFVLYGAIFRLTLSSLHCSMNGFGFHFRPSRPEVFVIKRNDAVWTVWNGFLTRYFLTDDDMYHWLDQRNWLSQRVEYDARSATYIFAVGGQLFEYADRKQAFEVASAQMSMKNTRWREYLAS